MSWPMTAALVVLLAIGLWLGDRALLAAERRGWIYWRRRRATSSSLGSAMRSVHGLLEPDKRHVVEERQRQEADIDVAGDDAPGDRGS